MKKIPTYPQSLLFFSVLSLAFFSVSQVEATSLTLTPQYQHDGLEFSEPLVFEKELPKFSLLTISFDTSSSSLLSLNAPSKSNVPLETLVTPKPKHVTYPTITPTKQPQPTTPFLTPTKTPTPQPTATPTPVPQPSSPILSTPGGLNADKLFSMANSYRAERGLPAFQKDERSCQLAAARAPEIAEEVATGTMHSGLQARNLPYWNTENIISMRTEEEAFTWWINDDIHRRAIEGNFTYSCVACSGNSCAQEFTNYQPK